MGKLGFADREQQWQAENQLSHFDEFDKTSTGAQRSRGILYILLCAG